MARNKPELDYELLGEMAASGANPEDAAKCHGITLKTLERIVKAERGMSLKDFFLRERWARICAVRKNERELTAKDTRMAIWIEENLFAEGICPEADTDVEFREEYVEKDAGDGTL